MLVVFFRGTYIFVDIFLENDYNSFLFMHIIIPGGQPFPTFQPKLIRTLLDLSLLLSRFSTL